MQTHSSIAGRRLLFVMNTPLVGGAERHTFELAGALREAGGEPGIFAIKAGTVPAPAGVPLLQPSGPTSMWQRAKDLAAEIRRASPDLLVAVNERPVLVCSIARRLAGRRVPVVAISHSTVLRNRKEEWMQKIYTPLFNRIEGVVFISRNQQRFWHARGLRPRNETLILNGIDTERFAPEIAAAHRDATRERYGLAPDDLVVGLCAVMRPEKNHLQIVEAIARLRAQGLPARALLVGDGPMREAIEARARALGIGEHVILAGMHPDVRPYVSAFDIGALCSVSIETLSLAALETMAMGIPMVMSELGGASEIVGADEGRLFPVGDLDGLCRAIGSLADRNARERAGQAARRKVLDTFQNGRMNAMYAQYLASLCR